MKFSFSSLYRRGSEPTDGISEDAHISAGPLTGSQHNALPPAEMIGADEPVTVFSAQTQLALHDVPDAAPNPDASFAIPRPSVDASRLSERWLAPGVAVNIAGTVVEGGMLYVGEQVRNADIRDPSAIVPSLEIAYAGDLSNPISGYYPRYGGLTPSQRRAYLTWLAGGRCAPAVDIGFVFLYFYGLERRVIVDGTREVSARADFPAIEREIKRLMALYATKSASFKGYATRLLSMIEAIAPREPPHRTTTRPKIFEHDTQGYLTWALAHCAADDAPLPGWLALLYLGARRRPKALSDHEAIYTRLFLSAYEEAFPGGLMLTQGRRDISITYKAASHGVGGARPLAWAIAGLPVPGNEESLFEWIQDVAQQATAQISAYAKAVRSPTASRTAGADSLHALLLLPRHAWQTGFARRFESLAADFAPKFPLMTLAELRLMLRIDSELSRAQLSTLAQVLQEHRVYAEPSLLARTKAPRDDDAFVLFLSDEEPPQSGDAENAAYFEARLSIHFAFSVATLGTSVDDALQRMDASAADWPDLTPYWQARVRAYVRLVHTEPKATARLNSRLPATGTAARRALAARIAALAIGNGTATADQVKALAKIYRALGAEPDQAILDIHRLGSIDGPPISVVASHAAEPDTDIGFRLDTARVVSLQRDTELTSALLADIFVDDAESSLAPAADPAQGANIDNHPNTAAFSRLAHGDHLLPGLDTMHSTFAQFLLTRDAWPRDDLLAAAAARDLLLDGALEVINDAAFDYLDMPFTEGEDPVMLNPELKERLVK